MKIGLVDADGHNFPNLPLMKISAYHKNKGDSVEFAVPLLHYDKVYVSRVFGDEYSTFLDVCYNADEVIYGGTGFAIKVENGKEVYYKELDQNLPYEIEHQYPDYSLYPEYTNGKAYGFLTRGCSNNCEFCIVSKKEGLCSVKVANLNEWWKGQNEIILLDPNILACKDRKELLQQLIDSKAMVDFTQGLDARFCTVEICKMLKSIKTKQWHFAFDFMKNKKAIIRGLKNFKNVMGDKFPKDSSVSVYCLTNFNTTFDEDYERVLLLKEMGYSPDIRIYRKNTAPRLTKDLQRWCNNRLIYWAEPNFLNYVPRNGKPIKELYFNEVKKWL